MEKTYLFYDIETTGLNKSFDQVVQFAAIRTDLALNEIDRYEYFIKLNCDAIPSPAAFITHRILPSQLEHGLNEFEAMNKIHSLMNTPGTISVGYNSLGFDDEFLRFSFYRNLLTPYTHQYANHCSRMDLYPMTVMYFLFKNSILKWPENNLKLENLIRINNLEQGAAHNAMVDVSATLKLARCFRQDLKTWDYLAGFFNKQTDLLRCQQVANLIHQGQYSVLIDGKFGHMQQYQAAALPLGIHHHYKNQFIWLRLDREELLQATIEDFQQHTWIINKKMGEPAWVLPMKDRFLQLYLKQKQSEISQSIAWIQKNSELLANLSNYYLNYTYPPIANIDVDAALYEKKFMSFQDQEICLKIHSTAPENKLKFLSSLTERHLQEILIRIMGRHFPHLLSGAEKELFQKYINDLQSNSNEEKSVDYKGVRRIAPQKAYEEIQSLYQQPINAQQKNILKELEHYYLKNFSLIQ